MFRRKKRRRRPLLAWLSGLVGLALLLAWKFLFVGDGPTPAGSVPEPALALGTAARDPQPASGGAAANVPASSAETPTGPPLIGANPAMRFSPASGGPPQPVEVRQPPLGYQPPSPEEQQRALQGLMIGLDLLASNKPVEARRALTTAIESAALDPARRDRARQELTRLNRRLVFSPEIVEGDPFVRPHLVGPKERLSGIVKDQSLAVDWRFIKRINRIINPRFVRPGQRLKLITGPFHAVVDKSDFRMDLYLGTGADRVFVATFPVGLGEFNSTPTGRFRVRRGSKLINPEWTNPRTGQKFGADDPLNPIGEYWIGLEGIDDATRQLVGYGIHGTIEPDSIGRDSSMGCIRMLPEDVAIVYEVLDDKLSTVEIRAGGGP